MNLYWDTSGHEIVICPRPFWGDGYVVAEKAAAWIDGCVPFEGWRELAAEFLRRFEK